MHPGSTIHNSPVTRVGPKTEIEKPWLSNPPAARIAMCILPNPEEYSE